MSKSFVLRAVPALTRRATTETGEAPALEGDPPNPINRPAGCHFHPRCPQARPICATAYPALRVVAPGRTVACHLYDEQPHEAGGQPPAPRVAVNS